jgi:hypothetical protein
MAADKPCSVARSFSLITDVALKWQVKGLISKSIGSPPTRQSVRYKQGLLHVWIANRGFTPYLVPH